MGRPGTKTQALSDQTVDDADDLAFRMTGRKARRVTRKDVFDAAVMLARHNEEEFSRFIDRALNKS